MNFDVLIKDGAVLDGTGNPSFISDLGIKAGKIVCVERNLSPASAQRTLHAGGMTVCPGFIDAHSHDDGYLLVNPRCEEKILQGVTCEVIGNCGFSLAPATPEHREDLRNTFIGAAHLPDETWHLTTFSDYLRLLKSAKPALSIAPLVGHHAVRTAVMGLEKRSPDPGELAQMRTLTRDAMRQGAFGLSTGLVYAPGMYADTEEINALASVVGRHGGIYVSHIRNESDRVMEAIDEIIAIGRCAGVPVHISHHKTMGRDNWGKSEKTLQRMAMERKRGIGVTCDIYPYTAGSTYLAAVLPPDLQAGGPQVFSQKLKDPEVRKKTIAEIENRTDRTWENLIRIDTFEGMVISFSNRHQDFIGKSIARLSAELGRNPYDIVFDLLVEEKMDVMMIEFVMDEKDVIRIMQDPFAMIGTDGLPGFGASTVHPRFTGTFPRVLGRYVRERKIMSLAEAVRKMTSFPARTFQVEDKGLIKEGFDADIVVFDPETIIDTATYTDSSRKPEGIAWVLINGEISAEHGEVTGTSAGKVLTRVKGF